MGKGLCYKRYPVREAEDFVGREDLIWKIQDSVFGTYSNSMALIGEDGTGKSSLMQYLALWETREKLLDTGIQNLVVPMNHGGARDFREFLLLFHEAIYEAIRTCPIMSDEVKTYSRHIYDELAEDRERRLASQLKDILQRLYEEEVVTVIMLDDIDQLTRRLGKGTGDQQRRELAERSFAFLRSLVGNTTMDVRYLTTSRKAIESVSRECAESGFSGVFMSESLSLFTSEEGKTYMERCGLTLKEKDQEWLMRVSGGIPGLLRSACRSWEEQAPTDEGQEAVEAFHHKVAKDAHGILRTHWESSDEEEKELFRKLAGGELKISRRSPVPEAMEPAFRLALERKLLQEDGTFTSEVFRWFVEKETPLLERQEGHGNRTSEWKEAMELYRKSAQMQQESAEKVEQAYQLLLEQTQMLLNRFASTVAGDELIRKTNARETLTDEEKETYNRHVVNLFRQYVHINAADLAMPPTLKNRVSRDLWEGLNESVRQSLLEAEMLRTIYTETDNDQSPVGVLYGTLAETVMNQIAFQGLRRLPMMQRSGKTLEREGKEKPVAQWESIYLGNLKYILGICTEEVYKSGDRRLMNQLKAIRNNDFDARLDTVRTIRNRCSHEKKTAEDRVSREDLDIMRDALLGNYGEDTGLLADLIHLGELRAS
ncbi:ATP-binding protein [Anoxynatronum sibiricum]|uniref:ATP-binding protein n=1 Tax=Anoxynatronum sibiricum TaxID=210623 RepID=A0ABU9VSC8_9CLOT